MLSVITIFLWCIVGVLMVLTTVMLALLIFSTSGSSKFLLNVEPAFDEAVFTGRAGLVRSLVPAALFRPAMGFGWQVFGPVQ